jgi:hypothetical protein
MQINNIMESLTFLVPLSREAHQIADQFRQQQLNPPKAQQVYLNTLSVYAVNFYLKCMGFQPDWNKSDSFDPMMQKFSDTADLNVLHLGKFECRPVCAEEQIVSIPLESMNGRRGYFAVQLNPMLTQAKILGFMQKVVAEEVFLTELKSLDFFLQYASKLENAVQLNQWLKNTFEVGWETIETLFSTPKIAWRSLNSDALAAVNSDLGVERIKTFNLEPTGDKLGLLVRLQPKTEVNMGISVELYPANQQVYLPHHLQLMLLDESGKTVMQAEARSSKNIQLKFNGESGEIFTVKVVLGNTFIVETFVI